VTTLKAELVEAKAKAKAFWEECARLRALRDSPNEFFIVFKGYLARDISIVFKAMSNLNFYHLSKGISMDFSVAFDPNLIPNFINIYPAQAVVTTRVKYIAHEP
jgi:hypothetical protein